MRNFQLIISVLLICYSSTVTAQSVLKEYVWPDNGQKYVLFSCSSWPACRTYAQSTLGGDLVIIDSQDENDMLFSEFGGYDPNFYIGATDAASEGHWKWVDGSTICSSNSNCNSLICSSYCNWNTGSGEPNDISGEDYGVLLRGSPHNGKWNDYDPNGVPNAMAEVICSGDQILFIPTLPGDGHIFESGTQEYLRNNIIFLSRSEADSYEVTATGSVHAKAEVRVTLGSGFKVSEGGEFKAEVGPVGCFSNS